VARHEDGGSKGYGFVSFVDFESSDAAIEHMNGQYLINKEISVQYAYKKDGKGERHGDAAERLLAAQAKQHGVEPAMQPLNPNMFQTPAPMPVAPGGMNDGRGAPMGYGGPGPYNAVPPPHMAGPPVSLPAPPAGLPARPPIGQGGLNGPPGFIPGGYSTATPPPMQGFAPPPGFAGPAHGMPGQVGPPGFGAPSGYPGR
jgi:splicing factor 3B subunit 4